MPPVYYLKMDKGSTRMSQRTKMRLGESSLTSLCKYLSFFFQTSDNSLHVNVQGMEKLNKQ